MQEYPQTVPNLTEIGQNLYDLVEYGNLILYGCKDLRQEAASSIAKDTGRGLRIVKEKSSKKIDQIVSLAMAAIDSVKDPGLLFPELIEKEKRNEMANS